MFKSKGTEKSAKSLLRSFGVNENLIKINLYADNAEYELKDTYSLTDIHKKTINLINNQKIEQHISDNGRDYLSASSLPLTAELMVVLPSTQKIENNIISLFGNEDIKINFVKRRIFGC